MTTFKSRQVNLDPEPYRRKGTEVRVSSPDFPEAYRLDPRPEFEPTRDPSPWVHRDNPGIRSSTWNRGRIGEWDWAPRREQFDTPVNPVLTAFREWGEKVDYPWALRCFLDGVAKDEFAPEAHREIIRAATFEQAVHARRVLARLVAFEAMNKNGGS